MVKANTVILVRRSEAGMNCQRGAAVAEANGTQRARPRISGSELGSNFSHGTSIHFCNAHCRGIS